MANKRTPLALFAIVSCLAVAATDFTATKIIRFVPSGEGEGMKQGYCWTNSIAAPRPDAWRCMAGNEIFDPCFQLQSGGSVLCNPNPAKGEEGFLLKLTQPLPSPETLEERKDSAEGGGWLIELSDGTLCSPATGARGLVDGKIVTCYCENEHTGGNIVLLGDLDTSSPIWMAEKAIMDGGSGASKLLSSEKVAVKTVWQ